MAVSIPISASASAAVAAIGEIRRAIEDAGQAGKKFADLDLSHGKQLSEMSADIQLLSQHMEELGRVGRGATATAFRKVGELNGGDVADPLAWAANVGRVFADPTAAAQHQARVFNYISQGTRWQPGGMPPTPPAVPPGPQSPAPPAPPGPAPTPLAGSNLSGSALGSILGGLRSGIGFGLALAGVSGIKSAIGEGIGSASEEAISNDTLLRHTRGTEYDALRESVRRATDGMGMAYAEAQKLALGWAQLTGQTDAATITASIRVASGAARAYGMDPGIMAAGLGQARNMGLDPRAFAALVGEAASKGGRSTDETLPALLRLSEAATRALVTKTNENDIAAMYAGLNATGLPGFRGAGAENMIGALTNTLANPGAGPAGQAFMYSALARQGVTNPYRQQFLREGGLFASAAGEGLGGTRTSMFDAMRQELMRQYPGNSLDDQLRRANAMENLSGGAINMRQSMALQRYSPAAVNTTAAALRHAGLDLSKLNETGIGEAEQVATANPAGLESWRQRMLGRKGANALSPGEAQELRETSQEGLRDALLKIVAKYGQDQNEGTETRASMAKLSNALDTAGEKLLGPLNALRDVTADAVTATTTLTDTMILSYKATMGDAESKAALMAANSSGRFASVGEDEPGLTDAIKKDRAKQAMTYFMGQGATRAEAAAYTAQIQSESQFNVHGKRGDGGMAQELLQWHPDRAAKIADHFGKPLSAMNYQEQLEAIWWETHGGQETEHGKAVHAAPDAFSAGKLATSEVVRPKDFFGLEAFKRGKRAEGLEAENLGLAPPPLLNLKPLWKENWLDGGKGTGTPPSFDLKPLWKENWLGGGGDGAKAIESDMLRQGRAGQQSPATPASTAPMVITIQPLEVTHKNDSGQILGTEYLPMTNIYPPASFGLNQPGEPWMLPNPPQSSREYDSYVMSRGREQYQGLDLNLTPKPGYQNHFRKETGPFRDSPATLPEQIPTQMPSDDGGVFNYSSPGRSGGRT